MLSTISGHMLSEPSARLERCRILADGSLDYPDDVLDRFDFVVASIHGRFKLDRKAQTQRLLRAIADPHTTIIGHMTARQLQRRPGYEIDVDKVLRACAPSMTLSARSTPIRGV